MHCGTPLGYFRLQFLHFKLTAQTLAQLFSNCHFVSRLSLQYSDAFLRVSITVVNSRCIRDSWLFLIGSLLIDALTKALIGLLQLFELTHINCFLRRLVLLGEDIL